MHLNWLKLNPDMTEVKICQGAQPVNLKLCGVNLDLSVQVPNLGITLDSNLFFKHQVSAIIRSAFFHLRNNNKTSNSSRGYAKINPCFCISSLNYCNTLYYGLPKKIFNDYILRSLHGLPIKLRILFKIVPLSFKSLNNQGLFTWKNF
ncbi:hypothetical protein XELAEV_18014658mg [Xenopus laevis]|uniref:Uncharacterized protein n=1 Tax=Xenopus laevis TaxID=8355 RepID=A0A974DGH2_XENLA|nr:hypothetical protein XELAEV_18014658mg [Xenopus laevis]